MRTLWLNFFISIKLKKISQICAVSTADNEDPIKDRQLTDHRVNNVRIKSAIQHERQTRLSIV